MIQLTLRHFLAIPLISCCFGLVTMACGPADTKTPTPEDKYTLDNVCEKTAPLNCAVRESCCTQATSGYAEAGCITEFTADCAKNVADVNAGIMTFDGDSIDACLAALQPYSDKCFLEIGDLLKLPVDLAPCSQIFVGQLKEGDTCERTTQCQSSLSDREIVQCDDTTKKCTTTRFLPVNSSCKLGQTVTEFCDEGLYCDFNILTMKGTCKTATPPGSPCTPGALSFECGLGYTCDSTSKVCVEAHNEGEACSTPLDCKSAKCSSNLCAKADPMFSKMQCTGMP
ncbi:MAG TPA: hypothetical protein PK156_45030 [Polyangium sp.]|nr:hypothetical protein [Polyangium sp.]